MKSDARNYLLFFFGCVLFHVLGTWSLPLIDRDEPRFAEAAREMIERNDYVIPCFNGQYRFDKPPFTYWAQVPSYKIFGENDFAARFPSTIAAALTGLVIVMWGKRSKDAATGWWAGIIFSLSLQTFVHAKAAVADMWLVLFVTAAHWAGWELLNSSAGQRSTPKTYRGRLSNAEALMPAAGWWWLFYVSLALAFLTKGPIGWIPLLTVAATGIFLHDRRMVRQFHLLPGIILLVLLVSLWGVPALIRTQGEFARIGIGHHVIGRSVSAMEGHGAKSFLIYLVFLPFYFIAVFASFFPWSLKVPWLVRKLRQERDLTDIYLLAGTAITFGIFTLVATKLPHYTLPAFPLLAMLLGRALLQQGSSRFLNRAATIALPIYVIIALGLPPAIAHVFPARRLFQQSRAYLRPEMEFGAMDFNEPSVVWYFRQEVKSFMVVLNQKTVSPFMAKTGPRFAILPTATAMRLFPNPPPDWKTFSTRGFNIPKGKTVDLTLIVKSE